MRVPFVAPDEDDFVDSPRYRFTQRVFLHVAIVIEKRYVRLEVRIRQLLEPFPPQLSAQSITKRFEPTHSSAADQDKRTAARPTTKARGSIEANLKWSGTDFTGRPP